MPLTGSTVEVGDPACDDPPALGTKLDANGSDDTPATLDPGDTWIYALLERDDRTDRRLHGVARHQHRDSHRRRGRA